MYFFPLLFLIWRMVLKLISFRCRSLFAILFIYLISLLFISFLLLILRIRILCLSVVLYCALIYVIWIQDVYIRIKNYDVMDSFELWLIFKALYLKLHVPSWNKRRRPTLMVRQILECVPARNYGLSWINYASATCKIKLKKNKENQSITVRSELKKKITNTLYSNVI